MRRTMGFAMWLLFLAIGFVVGVVATVVVWPFVDPLANGQISIGQLKRQLNGVSAEVVCAFKISDFPDEKSIVISFQSPIGFRSDFAIPTDSTDQLGRTIPKALAEELLARS